CGMRSVTSPGRRTSTPAAVTVVIRVWSNGPVIPATASNDLLTRAPAMVGLRRSTWSTSSGPSSPHDDPLTLSGIGIESANDRTYGYGSEYRKAYDEAYSRRERKEVS